VQLIERTYHGLTFHANYTWSKTMDLTSGINDISGEPNLIQDPHHPYQMYGLAASDQTNRFVMPFTYEVPNYHFAHKGLDWLTGGWTASGVYQVGSGLPFAVYGGEPTDQMGEDYAGRILADSTYATPPHFKSTLKQSFYTAKYSTPPLGRYGNTNKSPERTPYIENLDASFGKTTNFEGGTSLMLRVEFFNLGSSWHSPNSGLLFPDSTVTDSNFGSLINPTYGNVSLWNPRKMQLTGQFTF